MKLALLSLAALGILTIGQRSMTVPYSQVGRRVQITGIYGLPLGTYLILEGHRIGKDSHNSMISRGDFEVVSVNGRKLDEPVRSWVDEVAKLPAGAACTVTGYEGGSMTGVPFEVVQKGHVMEQQQPWQFRPDLRVIKVSRR